MSWDIEITDAAKDDLRDIFTYISSEFHAPDDARRIVRNILAEIQSLDEMPERFRPYPLRDRRQGRDEVVRRATPTRAS